MEALATPLRLGLATVFYTVAYAVGVGLFALMARRRDFETKAVRAVAGAALLGGLVGASFVQLLVSGEPGKSLLGGIACGWLATIWAKRAMGVRRPLGDAFAFALAGGEAIGRLGCFFAGCCYGKLANVPWAVEDHGAFRHPTQLYSALAALATLAVIAWLERRGALPANGIFYVQGALLCAFRFAIEFYRDVPEYGLLTLAQYACVAGFVYFAWRLRALVAAPLPQPA
jgi:phosphatidylglycerol:prolipoprotein diacylglycerol transferase